MVLQVLDQLLVSPDLGLGSPQPLFVPADQDRDVWDVDPLQAPKDFLGVGQARPGLTDRLGFGLPEGFLE